MRISNVIAVTFALLHSSTQISNQGRKGAWIHFKYVIFCPAAGKPEGEKKVRVNLILFQSLSCNLTPTKLC